MLTTLSLIALIGAAVLSFMNKENLANATLEQASMAKDLKRTEIELADSGKTLEGLDADLVTTTSELETFAAEAETLTTQIQTKEDELETLQGDLTEAQENLSTMREKIAQIGDLESAKAQIIELRSGNSALKGKLASLTSEVNGATQVSQGLQGEIDKITKLNEDQDKGIVPPDFSAAISQVYSDWGFVVLGAGNQQRAANGATLSVRRGGTEVAKIKITDLLQNRAVADVVRGSLADGVTLRPGDRAYPIAQ